MTKNCNESKMVSRKKSYAFTSWCSHTVAFCLDCHESLKISQQRTQTLFPPSWSEGWETLGALQRTALSLEVWSWRQVRERTGSQWFGSFFFFFFFMLRTPLPIYWIPSYCFVLFIFLSGLKLSFRFSAKKEPVLLWTYFPKAELVSQQGNYSAENAPES